MQLHDLENLLLSKGSQQHLLHQKADAIKRQSVGKNIYNRALIEVSNICHKNCYYCGIRKNTDLLRYQLSKELVVDLALNAYENGFRSLVLQSGEIQSSPFTHYIASILKEIAIRTRQNMHVTLSCGEQTRQTLQEWKQSGAHRYLLRIETSNIGLYHKIHPCDQLHAFEQRLETLKHLKELNYQVGSGILIGFPFQTIKDLAKDILFLKSLDLDMIGLGPYIEHPDTPLWNHPSILFSKPERLDLTLNTISLLRILCCDINIASATALEVMAPHGRSAALSAGANVFMTNLTPDMIKSQYDLYPGKNSMALNTPNFFFCINDWGDSLHYLKRNNQI
ncbi:MAG: [FeFe] hydrogenase H-cluster radical SAM maturase HydE [Bdellovibrionales bacterium RIFOXYB1_FULL_37_110]|nr:MAG: [FeFe] hydrogenase H-cluster radical SAM maturase HydE [Bdellovibrionales bacterium RIFOXYC1_FULL_37_79]OFZ58118.1 MAG: [FeFe] hydrogenase H-cluster radical SAM maturase HydE [Bdellovibrionales bacterium RIFOXYB1_FULL_37_110]OFZ61807.1 MAG: [FeFe] hydrogenase H-cluster radical SAM maturase HydE [Bdellovibrionales bacterium RIFOXYD1_FULL_36_51]